MHYFYYLCSVAYEYITYTSLSFKSEPNTYI